MTNPKRSSRERPSCWQAVAGGHLNHPYMGSRSFSAGTSARDSTQQAVPSSTAPAAAAATPPPARVHSLGETLDRGWIRKGVSAGNLNKDGSDPNGVVSRSSTDDTVRDADAGIGLNCSPAVILQSSYLCITLAH